MLPLLDAYLWGVQGLSPLSAWRWRERGSSCDGFVARATGSVDGDVDVFNVRGGGVLLLLLLLRLELLTASPFSVACGVSTIHIPMPIVNDVDHCSRCEKFVVGEGINTHQEVGVVP